MTDTFLLSDEAFAQLDAALKAHAAKVPQVVPLFNFLAGTDKPAPKPTKKPHTAAEAAFAQHHEVLHTLLQASIKPTKSRPSSPKRRKPAPYKNAFERKTRAAIRKLLRDYEMDVQINNVQHARNTLVEGLFYLVDDERRRNHAATAPTFK